MSRELIRVGGTPVKVSSVKDLQEGGSQDWRELVAAFVVAQDVKESSRSLYVRTLSQFFKWIEKNKKELSTLQREDILSYKDSLQEEGLAALTISSYIVAVRKFYEWTETLKVYPNIARGVKVPRKTQLFKKQHLTETKSAELLEHEESLSLRDFAIINLILRTGLRTIEITRANVEDITFKGERRILKVWGKGRTERDSFVVLSDKAYNPIKEYLSQERKGAKGREPLFTSQSNRDKGKRLSTRSVSRFCKSGLVSVGLDGREYTAHSLRHTTAVMILKQGGALTDVQNVLRHASPNTSQIYVESIREELRLMSAPEFLLDSAF